MSETLELQEHRGPQGAALAAPGEDTEKHEGAAEQNSGGVRQEHREHKKQDKSESDPERKPTSLLTLGAVPEVENEGSPFTKQTAQESEATSSSDSLEPTDFFETEEKFRMSLQEAIRNHPSRYYRANYRPNSASVDFQIAMHEARLEVEAHGGSAMHIDLRTSSLVFEFPADKAQPLDGSKDGRWSDFQVEFDEVITENAVRSALYVKRRLLNQS